jgi:magnesium-transporting ATPase (P-type)
MDERAPERRWKPLLWLGAALAAGAVVVAILARRWRKRPVEGTALPEVPPGLTEEEAAARWSEGQDNAVHVQPPRTRQQIWRENLYTIFNLSLVGLAFTQVLLGQWLHAVLSVGTIFLNVGLNVAQEVLALRRLAEFQRSARPKATVVREGKTRSIDPDKVVPGDVLIVGPGDQFLVDGQTVGDGRMVVDASVATGKQGWQTVRAGDPVYAGSFCVSGRGAYVAQKVGDQRVIVTRLANMPALADELTPLERLVDRTLRVLLALVAVFAVLLLAAFFRLDLGIPPDLFNDAASVIFGIAPSGLFLMIVVTYTTGTADLARLGALVHRARSVESLAEATVVCFTEAGILTGTQMEIEPVQQSSVGDSALLPESRLRQILGDYARSTSASGLVTRVLANTFEGNRRAIREEAPFLAAYGWSAVAFDERDLPGVYVLGEPAVLESRLVAATEEMEGRKARTPAVARRLVSPLRRLLRRGDEGSPQEGAEEANPEVQEAGSVRTGEAGNLVDNPEVDGEHPGARRPFFRRWTNKVGPTLRRGARGARREAEPAQASKAAVPETVLLFAHHSEAVSLRDVEGNIQLPDSLIPLCELHYARRLRPEAVEIVRGFAQTGVSIKVLASDEPDQLAALFQQASLSTEEEKRLGTVDTISGPELEQLPQRAWARAAAEYSAFGHITPAQAGALVRALRDSGESVAVVGDGVTDLPALQQATLAIARQTSTQAALGVADIVMMGNSPRVLLQVLHKGQRIVHGLLDVLKLSLTQVFYLALLIAAIQIASVGFPYLSAQGTAIAVITVTIPSVGLSLWARAGVVSSASFGRSLVRFVAPAAVSMCLAALLVYVYFLDRSGRIAYAQLAVAYTLIYAGLLLAVFCRPPWHPSQRVPRQMPQGTHRREDERKRDGRMAGLALFLGVVTFFLPWIPAAQKYLRLDWLQQPADYGIVGLVVVGWALALRMIWWLIPPEGYSGTPEGYSGTPEGYSAPSVDEGARTEPRKVGEMDLAASTPVRDRL